MNWGPRFDHVISDFRLYWSVLQRGLLYMVICFVSTYDCLFYFSQGSTEQKDLRDSIRAQRLKNMALSRLNNELNQELQEVMEQRIALEIQLEHLQPFHS